jgi:hypothetical protein
MRSKGFAPSLALAAALALSGCHRDEVWDQPAGNLVAHGLAGSAAILDDPAHRALFLPIESDLSVKPVSLPIGRGYAASATTPDGSRLLVLSRGDVPRKKADDQGPTLTLLDGGPDPRVIDTYPLTDPLSGLDVDPEGRFGIVYPSASDTSFVANPNELSILDLTAKPSDSNPTPLTLRSFGGRPQAFFFTPTLELPTGPRRLLTVLTDRDVGIIDLSAPAKGDITVPLNSTGDARAPLQIAVSDGAPGVTDDARLAIRVAGDSSVILVDLLPVPAGQEGKTAHDFRPTPNVVFAGGVPSDIAFVSTDGGLRLAAVVPSKQALALVDPTTGIATSVDLGASFEHISIVTSVVGPTASGADVALLWSSYSPAIAFVALGSTVGKPYKSVERLSLASPIEAVYDVPAPNQQLKILKATGGSTFFVLDLVARTASPILASGGNVDLSLSPDGKRAWVITPSSSNIAALDLATLHPTNLLLAEPVAAAFDVARRGGGRALVALHAAPSVDVTVLDGERPSLETALDLSSVLLGELP